MVEERLGMFEGQKGNFHSLFVSIGSMQLDDYAKLLNSRAFCRHQPLLVR